MRIGRPDRVRCDGYLEYRVRVDCAAGPGELWYRVAEPYGDFVADGCDAPLVALLIPAMARGEDIQVEGPVSTRLYYNVSRAYQRVLQHVIPSLRPVRIQAGEVRPAPPGGPAVLSGFSAGIDSFCLLADHHYASVPPPFRLTHLLFNNVGSHGRGERGERLFNLRHARAVATAERIGLPLIRIDSNLDAYFGKPLDFRQTHTPRNASAALLLQRGARRFMYAASYGYEDVGVGLSDGMARSDMVALPMLSTEEFDVMSVGSEYSRVEKTLRVAELAESHDSLDVCTDPDRAGNCSACEKCLRTLLTLEIAGLLETYRNVFDLDRYARHRERFMREALTSDDAFMREIVRFARVRGFRFPKTSLLGARLEVLARAPVRAARRLVNPH